MSSKSIEPAAPGSATTRDPGGGFGLSCRVLQPASTRRTAMSNRYSLRITGNPSLPESCWPPRSVWCSCGFPPEQGGAPVVLVEPVEQWRGVRKYLIVGAHHRQSAQRHVETWGFGGVEALVVEVRLVHDFSELPQHRVVELVAAQDRLERAVPVVVGQLHPSHVERGGIRGHVGGVVDEAELRVRVEAAADEPRARRPVDVHPGASRPLHGCTSLASVVMSAAGSAVSASTAARARSRSGGGK